MQIYIFVKTIIKQRKKNNRPIGDYKTYKVRNVKVKVQKGQKVFKKTRLKYIFLS